MQKSSSVNSEDRYDLEIIVCQRKQSMLTEDLTGPKLQLMLLFRYLVGPYNTEQDGQVVQRSCLWDKNMGRAIWSRQKEVEKCKLQSSVLTHLGMLGTFALNANGVSTIHTVASNPVLSLQLESGDHTHLSRIIILLKPHDFFLTINNELKCFCFFPFLVYSFLNMMFSRNQPIDLALLVYLFFVFMINVVHLVMLIAPQEEEEQCCSRPCSVICFGIYSMLLLLSKLLMRKEETCSRDTIQVEFGTIECYRSLLRPEKTAFSQQSSGNSRMRYLYEREADGSTQSLERKRDISRALLEHVDTSKHSDISSTRSDSGMYLVVCNKEDDT
uniref:Teneurin N-terminal domain-containing protein n=1 Tax=Heterorhabditis bacteriophora TaxID=37862 RepID=A0A1I7XA00_HETBA